MSDGLYEIRFADGAARVEQKTAIAIEALTDLQRELVSGQVASVLVARVLNSEDIGGAIMVYFDPLKLAPLRDTISDFAKKCDQQASLWEGSAPPANRSFGLN